MIPFLKLSAISALFTCEKEVAYAINPMNKKKCFILYVDNQNWYF